MTGPRPAAARVVLVAVSEALGVPVRQLVSTSRIETVAVARGVAAYLLRETLGASLAEVGVYLHRHHSTIWQALAVAYARRAEDEAYFDLTERLRMALRAVLPRRVSRRAA